MRLAPIFFFGGLALTYLAVQYGGVAYWVLIWPGASLMSVGIAYAGLGAVIFGKKSDGRLPAWSVILHLPYLLAIWGIWWSRRWGAEPSRQLVAPGVWLGRRPREGEVPEGVGLVVDLTAEFPRPPGARDVGYRCLPTLDGCAPRAKKFQRLVDDVARAEEDVYLCCAAGHGRSAALAAAVLIARNQAADVDEAEQILQATRPRVALTKVQRKLVVRATGSRADRTAATSA
jgi:protein-tyrosine phosphatase